MDSRERIKVGSTSRRPSLGEAVLLDLHQTVTSPGWTGLVLLLGRTCGIWPSFSIRDPAIAQEWHESCSSPRFNNLWPAADISLGLILFTATCARGVQSPNTAALILRRAENVEIWEGELT
jgi:hypothetical protein